MIDRKVWESLDGPVGPDDLSLVDAVVCSQAEMETQIMLREVTSTAANFIQLHEFASCEPHARVQSEPIRLSAFELKTHPVVICTSLGSKDHGLADQVFDHGLEPSVIE